MSFIANLLGIGRRANGDALGEGKGWKDLLGRTSISGKRVNYDTALSVAAVYACVRIIAETIATLPLNLYEPVGEWGKKTLVDDPLYWLIKYEPNPEQTAVEFWEMQTLYAALRGNAFTQVIRDKRTGRPTQLWPLNPDHVWIQRKNGDLVYHVYHDSTMKRKAGVLMPDEIMHFRLHTKDGVWGMSPMELHQDTIGLALVQQEFASQTYKNAARPSGILYVEGSLNPQERAEAREEWKTHNAGAANAGNTPILPAGIKWEPMALKHEEIEYIASCKFLIEEIGRIFRVPAPMLNDHEHSTYNNVEQLQVDFIQNTMRPWMVRWEQCIMRSLLVPSQKRRGVYAKFNERALLRGSMKDQAEYFTKLVNIGVHSINEVRAKLDENPIEGGDVHRVQMQNVDILKLDELVMSKHAAQKAANKDKPEPENVDSEPKNDGKPAKKQRIGREFQQNSLKNAFRTLLSDEYLQVYRKEGLVLSKTARKLTSSDFDEWLKQFREDQRKHCYERVLSKMRIVAEGLLGEGYTEVLEQVNERCAQAALAYADGIEHMVRELQQRHQDQGVLAWPQFIEALDSDELGALRAHRAKQAAIRDIEAILTLEGEEENVA